MSAVEDHLAHEAHDDFPDLAADHPDRAPAGSLLGSLQRKRQELARRETRQAEKIIPGWEGALRVVYRYPEAGSDPIIKAVERAQTRGKPGDVLNANADVLIACAYDMEGRTPGGDWEPLDPEGPTKVHSAKLARMLQIEVPDGLKSPGRFIVRNVFSPGAAATGVFEGDVALLVQGGEIIRWLQGAEVAADEDLRGE